MAELFGILKPTDSYETSHFIECVTVHLRIYEQALAPIIGKV